jgi:cell division protein FtsN
MARDFKAKPKEKKPNGFGSSLSFVTGLLIGLTAAVVVYFSGLGHRPVTPEGPGAPAAGLPAPPEPEPIVQEDHSALAPASTGTGATGEPEFDFYTILPEVEVKVPEAELAEPVEQVPPPEQPAPLQPVPQVPAVPAPGTPPPISTPSAPVIAYIVQVGAYQQVQEADQTKALLALQGISSAIQRITKEGQGVWFRVIVGPYATAPEAQAARTRLANAGFKTLLLKSGGGSG